MSSRARLRTLTSSSARQTPTTTGTPSLTPTPLTQTRLILQSVHMTIFGKIRLPISVLGKFPRTRMIASTKPALSGTASSLRPPIRLSSTTPWPPVQLLTLTTLGAPSMAGTMETSLPGTAWPPPTSRPSWMPMMLSRHSPNGGTRPGLPTQLATTMASA